MNHIKLLEVKDLETENNPIVAIATLCENCGWLVESNVVKIKVNIDDIMSKINDELDITKRRIERILRECER